MNDDYLPLGTQIVHEQCRMQHAQIQVVQIKIHIDAYLFDSDLCVTFLAVVVPYT
jgi:hypothetical protein